MAEAQRLDRLRVAVSEMVVGILGRDQQRRNSVFTYASSTSEELSVSLTMPVRPESYTWESGVPPSKELLEQVVHGMDLAMDEMRRYMGANQQFRATGEAMIEVWTVGLARSLKPGID